MFSWETWSALGTAAASKLRPGDLTDQNCLEGETWRIFWDGIWICINKWLHRYTKLVVRFNTSIFVLWRLQLISLSAFFGPDLFKYVNLASPCYERILLDLQILHVIWTPSCFNKAPSLHDTLLGSWYYMKWKYALLSWPHTLDALPFELHLLICFPDFATTSQDTLLETLEMHYSIWLPVTASISWFTRSCSKFFEHGGNLWCYLIGAAYTFYQCSVPWHLRLFNLSFHGWGYYVSAQIIYHSKGKKQHAFLC